MMDRESKGCQSLYALYGLQIYPGPSIPKTLTHRSQATAGNPLRNGRRARLEILSRNRCFRKPRVDLSSGVDYDYC